MSKKFKVIATTGNPDNNQTVEVTQGQGGRGQPVRLQAKAGAKYQLLDLEKAKAVGPDFVKVKRLGKNLHILFEGGSEADVIIEDYYNVMPEGYNGVVGQAENGSFYEYSPEVPDVRGLIPQLADGGQAVSVVLGGTEVAGSGAAIAISAFNPVVTSLLATTGVLAQSQIGSGATDAKQRQLQDNAKQLDLVASEAAAAASTAAAAVNTAKGELDAAIAALPTLPTQATPDHLALVEAKQTAAIAAATDASKKVIAATAAANAASTAATEAGEAEPASVAAAKNAAEAANTAATAANNAANASEVTTDAQVAALVQSAVDAGTAMGAAQTAFNSAVQALTDAVTALGTPATPAQLTAAETAQTALTQAATNLQTAANTAQAAVTAANAAAAAANETAPNLSAVTTAITTATKDAASATGSTTNSEAATDAKVATLAAAAEAAATAANNAAAAVTAAQGELATAVAALSTPATPVELTAVEAKQTAAQAAATDAASKAAAATQAATTAHNAAVAANEFDPAAVAAANNAATAASTAANAASTAATNSEAATDAKVAALAEAAEDAAMAAKNAAAAATTAQVDLATAVAALGTPATSTQLTALITLQTAAQTTAIDAVAKATAATQAATAAHNAAAAAQETDPAAVALATAAATEAQLAAKAAALEVISSAAQANNATSNTPSENVYTLAGVNGVTPANLLALSNLLNSSTVDGAATDTTGRVQGVVDQLVAYLAAMDAIVTAAQNNSANATSPSETQYATVGVTGVNSGNIAAINSALNSSAVNGTAVDTPVKLQGIVDSYNTILRAADGTAANALALPSDANYATIGANIGTASSDTENLSLLNDIVGGLQAADVDSISKINELARIVNAIQSVAATVTSTPALTPVDFLAVGLSGVTADNLSAVLAAIAAKTDAGNETDSLSELQTIVNAAANAAANALGVISSYAETNTAGLMSATGTAPELNDFTAAAVDGVNNDNLAAIRDALASSVVNGEAANTRVELQGIVDAYHAILNEANGSAPDAGADPTAAQYTAIGVTGVTPGVRADLLGDVIGSKNTADVNTVAEVQTLANAVAAVMANAAGTSTVSAEQLQALSITGVTPDNIAAVQAAIADTNANGTGVDSQSDLQTLVTTVNNAVSVISTYAQANSTGLASAGATPIAPTATDYANAGVTGFVSGNLSAINDALASSNVTGLSVDTPAEIHTLVNAYNTIIASADGINNNATAPTTAQYAAIGVNGVDSAVEVSLLADVIDLKGNDDVNTVAQVQALADAVQAVMNTAAGLTPAATEAQLNLLGVTGVTSTNLSRVLVAIASTPDGGSAVSTLSGLQAVANVPQANATLTSVTDDFGSVTGTVDHNGYSDDATPTLAGTVTGTLAAGQVVAVYDTVSGTRLGAATVTGSNWTFTPTSPISTVKADFSFQAVVENAYGLRDDNPSAVSSMRFDNTALTVVSKVSDAIAKVADLKIVFNQDVVAVTGKQIKLYDTDGDSLVATIDVDNATIIDGMVTINQASVTINPANDFVVGKTYYATIDEGAFRTLSGINFAGYSSTTDWTFYPADPVTTVSIGGTSVDASNGINAAELAAMTIGGTVTSSAWGSVSNLQIAKISFVPTSGNAVELTTGLSTISQANPNWTLANHADWTSQLESGKSFQVVVELASTVSGTATTSIASTSYTLIDTAAPTIAIDATLAGDNVVNAAEDNDFIVSGTTTDVEDGQTVTVTFTDSSTPTPQAFTKTATVLNNAWSLSVAQKADISAFANDNVDITASVSDRVGNPAVAANKTVALDNALPTINGAPSITDNNGLSNSTLSAGDSVTFTVSFSEAVTVDTTGGSPRLTLNIGGSLVQAAYLGGSNTSALTFSYTVLSGQNDVDGISVAANALVLNGSTIKDASGNPAVVSHVAMADNAGFLVDTAAPAAPTLTLGSGVSNGATSAEATAAGGVVLVTAEQGASVVVTFSNGINSVPVTVIGNGSTPVPVTLTPANLATLGNGTINVSALATDAGGNASNAGSTSFELDTSAPTTPTGALMAYVDNVGATQNNASTVSSTDDTTPGIQLPTGLNTSGDTVKLYVDGVLTAATYDNTTGVLTPNSALATSATAKSFTYTLTDAVGNESGQSPALSIAILAAPVFTSGTTASFAENTATSTAVYTAAAGTGITYSIDTGVGADGSKFSINSSTGALTFVASPNFEVPTDAGTNNVYDMTVRATNVAGAYTNQTVAVTVTNVNEAPVNTVPAAQTVNEDTALAITGISVADVDNNLVTTQLSVSNGSLTVSLAGGATVSAGVNGSATVTLSGTATQINAALATLSYTGSANFNGSATLTVLSTDAGDLTDSDTVAITVTAVNDAPVLATGSTLAYTENAAATAINTAVTLSDVDNTTFASATVTVKDASNNVLAEDVLSFNNVSMGNITSSYNADTGVLTLTSAGATATQAQWQAALRAVTYSNTSDAPSTSARTVSYKVNDGAADSNVVTSTINVSTANDAPVLADTALSMPAVVQGATAPVNGTAVGTFVSALVGGITDADANPITGIAITGVNTGGTLYYSLDGGTNWTAFTDFTNNRALGILSDSDNRVYFMPASSDVGTVSNALTFRAWDQSGGAAEGAVTWFTGTTASYSSATDTISQYVVKPVTINAVSTDNVVSSAETLVISGTADNNATVALTVKGQTVNVVADASGNWSYDGSKVRYIMVRKDLENKAYGTGIGDTQVDAMWNIGDVRAMDGATNRATSATVTFSSNGTKSPNGSLIDGSATTYVEIGGSSYSAADRDVWVQLDLGASYALSSIDVLARAGGWAERLNGSVVYTSNQDMSTMTRAQLDAAFNVNSSVVSVNNDGTVYTVTSPTSTNGLDLATGSNTVSATETVSGVTSTATRAVVRTSTWTDSNTFDGTDPLAGGAWSTTGGSAGTTANTILNVDVTDADNEFKILNSGVLPLYRASSLVAGADQVVAQFDVAFDMDVSGMLASNSTNRFELRYVTAGNASNLSVGFLEGAISVTFKGVTQTLTGATLASLSARTQDRATVTMSENGTLTITLVGGGAPLTWTTTVANWAAENTAGGRFLLYGDSQSNGSAGWIDNLQINTTLASRVTLPIVSNISVYNNTSGEVLVTPGTGSADTTPLLKGTATAGASVKVYEGTQLLASTTADATTGAWSVESAALTNGAHTLTVRAVDANGNIGEPTTVSLLVNTTTSTWTYTNNFDNAIDPMAGGTLRIDSNLTTSGFSRAINNADTSDTDLEFKIIDGTGTEGLQLANVMAIGANQRMEAFTAAFDMDMTNVAASPTNNRFELRYASGVANGFPIGLSIKFAEASIAVYWNDTLVASQNNTASSARGTDRVSVSMDAAGNFSVGLTGYGTGSGNAPITVNGTVPSSLWTTQSMANYKFSLFGDIGTIMASSAWIDNLAINAMVRSSVLLPTATITHVNDNAGAVTGAVTSSIYTDDTQPTLTGMATPGSLVHVYDGDFFLGAVYAHMTTGVWTFAVNGTGVYTYSAAGGSQHVLSQGMHTLNVRAVDASGNMGEASSFSLLVDSMAPTGGTLTLATDTGSSASDRITSNGLINVTGLEGGTTTWQYSTDAGLTWTTGVGTSFTLADGIYAANAVQVRQTDAAGLVQVTPAKYATQINVDTSTPAAPLAVYFSDDHGTSGSDWTPATDAGASTLYMVAASGARASSETAQYSTNGGSTWSNFLTAFDTSGLATGLSTFPFFTTTTTYSFSVLDAAGNASSVITKTFTPSATPTSAATAGTFNVPSVANGSSVIGSGSDDIFVLDQAGITNYLSQPTAYVEGHYGNDTLRLTGAGTSLNLLNYMNDYTLNKIQSMEFIDMSTDTGAQTLIGNAQAFVSLTRYGWLNNANLSSNYQLVIKGDSADTLVLGKGDGFDTTGFTKTGTSPSAANTGAAYDDGIAYDIWTDSVMKVQLLVQQGIVVTSENAATNSAPVLADTTLTMDWIARNAASPTGAVGTLVSTLVGGITDSFAASQKGIAITGVNSTNGTLYFSTDGGANWSTVTGTSDTNALLLAADGDNRLYFKPNANYTGTVSDAITLRAWDRTSGADGAYFSTATNGGTSAFSNATDTVAQQVQSNVAINTVSSDGVIASSEALVVSGTAAANTTVALSFNNQTINVTADSFGNWAYNGGVLVTGASLPTVSTITAQTTVSGLTTTASTNVTVFSLTSSSPTDNGYVMSLTDNLTLTFNQAVTSGTGNIVLFSADGITVESFNAATGIGSAGGALTWGANTVTINPFSNLTASTGYYLQIAATAVKDTAGNVYAGIADSTTLNFSTADAAGVIAVNSTASTGATWVYLGEEMAALGDFNGDGYGDFIVGADVSGSSVVDSAYVIYGNANGTVPNLSGNSIAASAGFKIVTGVDNDSAGASVASAGDINGDGLADAVMTVQKDNTNPSSTSNSAFLIYGKSNASTVYGSSLNVSGIASSLGFQIKGNSDFFGRTASNAGDVNGDGLNDLLVTGDNNAFVIYGSASGGTIDLVGNNIASSQGYKITTANALDLGASASGAGDFNGDGLADVIVSATDRAYVIYGKSSASAVVIDGANSIDASNGFRIQGVASFGRAVSSAGDVNGDGLADVMISSRSEGNGGTVYVLYGNTSATVLDLDVSGGTIAAGRGFKITSAFTTDDLGSNYTSISSAGDVNGDGLADMIISGRDSTTASERSTYIVYGNPSGATVAIDASGNIAASLGFKIKGAVGYSVANGGDINGDGLTDLLVSAQEASSTYSYNVILGGTQWVTSVVRGSGTVTGTASGEAVLGSTGIDTLTGGGGVDHFVAGMGNDTVVLTASDMTNLADNATLQTAKSTVHGGTGFDTIRLSGGANLDLTAISNASAMGLDENSRIESIERIDLATDTTANTLTLAARDVKDMAGFNLIRTGSVSADGNTWTNVTGTALPVNGITAYHQLVVEGSSNDTLVLSPDTGFWTNAGTVNNGSNNYTVYQNAATNSQVLVKSGVTVTNNDSVAPVVIDLNRDGQISYSSVTMDVNGDGQLDRTAWAGASDGVLIWDKYMDGLVHDNSQYAFAQYATTYANGFDAQGKAPTDLSGLAEAFDSNHDGMFDAQDAKFAEFKVWQDVNQNGVSDAGEVRSLADWGMASINLVSDGVVRTPVAGVTEAGRTIATTTDGQSMLVADAAFAFRTATSDDLAWGESAVQAHNLSPEPLLDLSALLGQTQQTGADWTAAGLQTETDVNGVTLSLSDVLSLTPQAGLYQHQLLGDANDRLPLSYGDVMSLGEALVPSDEVFSGVSNASSQWLIDQHIMTLQASS